MCAEPRGSCTAAVEMFMPLPDACIVCPAGIQILGNLAGFVMLQRNSKEVLPPPSSLVGTKAQTADRCCVRRVGLPFFFFSAFLGGLLDQRGEKQAKAGVGTHFASDIHVHLLSHVVCKQYNRPVAKVVVPRQVSGR